MSVQGFKAAVRAPAPSGPAKTVMMLLGFHHDPKTGRCFPSYERLAEEGNMAKSTVTRAIKELEEAKLITKVKAKRAGTYNASNHYVLHFMQTDALISERVRHHGYGRRAMSAARPDRDTPTSPLRSEVGAAKPKKKRSHRAKPRFRIDPSWTPARKDLAVAAAAGFSDSETDLMAETFRDYWISQGKTSADWSARWRMWVANQTRFAEEEKINGQRGTGPRRGPTDRVESIRAFDRAIREGVGGGGYDRGLRREGPEGLGHALGGQAALAAGPADDGPDG